MENPPPSGNTARRLWQEWFRPLLAVAAVVLPIKSAIADWNWVPTGSMKPTILEGDLVFVNKLAFDLKVPFTLWRLARWNTPRRDEIIVFFSPKDGTRLVKRVIGLPGDTVELRGNVVFRNGVAMRYELAAQHPFARELYEDPHALVATEHTSATHHWVVGFPSLQAIRTFPPLTVPPGKYFVMGDSRDNSLDSRYFGFVPQDSIVGRTTRVILSFDKNHYYVPRLRRVLATL